MQQIQNAIQMLSVSPEPNSADATGLGPGVSEAAGKSSLKQSDGGFGRVLQKQQSQAGSDNAARSKPANGEDSSASQQADDATASATQQGPAEQGGDAGAEEQAESGNIMPPPEDDLPPANGTGDRDAADLAAEQLAAEAGDQNLEDQEDQSGLSARDLHGGLSDGDTAADAERPIPVGVPVSRQATPNRSGDSAAPAQMADAAISARADGGNSEAARESGRAFGQSVQASREAIRSATPAEAGQQPAPEVDELVSAERGVRKDAGQERAELAVGRVNPAGVDAEVQAPRATPTVNVAAPAADAALVNSTRPGAVLQAGMEAPVGARIAVGQEGWNTLIAQRIATLAARGSNGAEIQLDPPDLGPIKVTIQMSGDQTASVTVQSHSQAVRDALEQSAHRLREMFNQSGLDLSSLDVSDHNLPQGRGDEQGEAGKAGQPAEARPDHDDQGPLAETPVKLVLPDQPGRIDFYI